MMITTSLYNRLKCRPSPNLQMNTDTFAFKYKCIMTFLSDNEQASSSKIGLLQKQHLGHSWYWLVSVLLSFIAFLQVFFFFLFLFCILDRSFIFLLSVFDSLYDVLLNARLLLSQK